MERNTGPPFFPSIDDEQRQSAEVGIQRAQGDWPDPIVTTIEEADTWYPAEDYHQEYWEGEGQRNPYCLAVIPPKLQKLKKRIFRPAEPSWLIVLSCFSR